VVQFVFFPLETTNVTIFTKIFKIQGALTPFRSPCMYSLHCPEEAYVIRLGLAYLKRQNSSQSQYLLFTTTNKRYTEFFGAANLQLTNPPQKS